MPAAAWAAVQTSSNVSLLGEEDLAPASDASCSCRSVHSCVDVSPGIGHRGGVEAGSHRPDLRELQEARPFGNQQTDRELDRRDVLDEVEAIDRLEQRAVAFERRPWGEGHERRRQRQPCVPAERRGTLEAGARVTLLQLLEHLVVNRLDRARHERAASLAEHGEQVGVREEMFDLDRDVVRDLGKLRMERAHDREGMPDPVEEVGIAEGNVPCSGRDLPPHVRQDDLGRHDAEAPVVDRNDRAMPAPVFTAAARLGVADDAQIGADAQLRVPIE